MHPLRTAATTVRSEKIADMRSGVDVFTVRGGSVAAKLAYVKG